MPFCKSCGSRISRFDKELCPICGTKKPLEGASSDTVEITTELDIHNKDSKKVYNGHFRLDTFLWFMLLGWTGAGFFYLNFKKRAIIWLIANLIVIGGLLALFGILIGFNNWIVYVAPFAAVYLINIGVAIYYLCKRDVKDGNGEFIH